MKKFSKGGELGKKTNYSLWFSILENIQCAFIKADGVQGKIHLENFAVTFV